MMEPDVPAATKAFARKSAEAVKVRRTCDILASSLLAVAAVAEVAALGATRSRFTAQACTCTRLSFHTRMDDLDCM